MSPESRMSPLKLGIITKTRMIRFSIDRFFCLRTSSHFQFRHGREKNVSAALSFFTIQKNKSERQINNFWTFEVWYLGEIFSLSFQSKLNYFKMGEEMWICHTSRMRWKWVVNLDWCFHFSNSLRTSSLFLSSQSLAVGRGASTYTVQIF